jgi:cytochrome c
MRSNALLAPLAAAILTLSVSAANATSHETTKPREETRSSVPQIVGQATTEAGVGKELAAKAGCNNCHAVDTKKMGPSYQEIAKRHKGNATAQADIVAKLRSGKGHPKTNASEADLNEIVKWVLATS